MNLNFPLLRGQADGDFIHLWTDVWEDDRIVEDTAICAICGLMRRDYGVAKPYESAGTLQAIEGMGWEEALPSPQPRAGTPCSLPRGVEAPMLRLWRVPVFHVE